MDIITLVVGRGSHTTCHAEREVEEEGEVMPRGTYTGGGVAGVVVGLVHTLTHQHIRGQVRSDHAPPGRARVRVRSCGHGGLRRRSAGAPDLFLDVQGRVPDGEGQPVQHARVHPGVRPCTTSPLPSAAAVRPPGGPERVPRRPTGRPQRVPGGGGRDAAGVGGARQRGGGRLGRGADDRREG